jgi:hypothetical protein
MPPADFMAGLITAIFLVCGLFFVRFWIRSREGLFVAFALTFFLLALGHGATAVFGLAPEERTWIYLTRLAAFLILIVAIIRKNFAK